MGRQVWFGETRPNLTKTSVSVKPYFKRNRQIANKVGVVPRVKRGTGLYTTSSFSKRKTTNKYTLPITHCRRSLDENEKSI